MHEMSIAISIVDEEEARKSLDAWAEMLEATEGGINTK